MVRLIIWASVCLFILTLSVAAQNYIILGWNDLGMHCSNKDFSTLTVLPPFNTVMAQAIQVGDAVNPPQIITTNFHVTYEIPGNTYSVGKTNFWDFEDQIFGVTLPDNIGLTGIGLTGDMSVDIDHFVAVGIPLTPFQDADLINEAPFQLGLLKLYDQFDQLLASTNPVVPVSNEINCLSSGCHLSEQAILNQHAAEAGFDPGNTPILCATCHASNALGMAGNPNLPSLSEAIHKHHGEYTDDCYKCHPGPVTHCLRDVMSVKHGFVCQTCHGSVTQVGESISSGREPWFQEPSCGALSCHGPNFAEEPGKLYRMSRGHGGLYCSACHGEPHAIVPSREPNDNLQNISLQGHAGTLDMCIVCHGVVPSGAGPHGVLASNCCLHPGDADHNTIVSILDVTFMISAIYKNGPHPPCNGSIDGQYPEADANGNGAFNILDVTYLIAYLYKSGPAPICGPA